MATIETAHASDWLDLHSLVDEYFTHYDSYIFRGQANADWLVESTLTRAFKRLSIPPKKTKAKVKEHLLRFKEHVRGRSTVDLRAEPDDTLWSLGQHYGLFTPLLDWSRSPYVALYFSLLGASDSGTRSLYAIVETDVPDLSRAFSKKDEVQVIKPLSHENARIVSQGGLFLKLPVGSDLVSLVNATPDCGWVTLYKITYPDSIRNDALAALNNMNINHTSLFPDLLGSSQHTNYLLEIESHLEHGRDQGVQRGRTEA